MSLIFQDNKQVKKVDGRAAIALFKKIRRKIWSMHDGYSNGKRYDDGVEETKQYWLEKGYY